MILSLDQANYLRIKGILAAQPCVVKPENTPNERGWRDERDEVGVQTAHVAPFSHAPRFTRHSLWRWRTFSPAC